MDKLNIIFGVIGLIGTVFSIFGAFKSTKESKKAVEIVKEINEKKTAFDLGILSTRVDKLHKEIYSLMIARMVERGANKEFDTYRKWYDELSIILNEIPVEMKDIIETFEEVKEIISFCVMGELSLHDFKYKDDSGFRKVESSIYNISKDLKYRIHNISQKR